MKILDLYVEIQGDITELSKALDTGENQLKNFSRKASEIGDKLTKDLTTPLVNLGKAVVNAAAESEASQRKLQNALKATGQEVDSNTKAISKLASALQQQTKFEDDAIVSAGALLTQLGQLDAQGVQKVLPSVLDFAEAMGVDLETAAQLVAKTLGSNTNALARYGIDVDGSADKTTKLAAITDQLTQKFGGAAEAAGDTFSGKAAQLQNQIGDLAEEFGGILLPILSDLIETVKPFIQGFTNLDDNIKKFILTIAGIAAGAGPAISAIGGLGKALDVLGKGPLATIGVVAGIVAGIAAITTALDALADSANLTADEARELNAELTATQKEAEAIIGPVNELTENNLLTRDSVQELLDKYPELNGQLKLNETSTIQAAEAVRLITLKKKEELKAEIDLQKARMFSTYLLAQQKITELERYNSLNGFQRAELDAARKIEGQYLDLNRQYLKIDGDIRALNVSVYDQVRAQEAARVSAERSAQAQAERAQLAAQASEVEAEASQKASDREAARLESERIANERRSVAIEEGKILYKDYNDYLQSLQDQRLLEVDAAALESVAIAQRQADAELDIFVAQQEAEQDAFLATQAEFEKMLARSQELATDWSDTIKMATGIASTSFGNVFEAIGEGIISNSLSWEALAKIALESISAVLRGLGEQLLAKSIAYAIEAAAAAASIIGLPLVPGLTTAAGITGAGAAGAFLAAGIVKGLANSINVPQFAVGTNFAPGGMALVGEYGPELVNLPRGSQVLSNARTESILNQNTENRTYNFYSPKQLDQWEIKKAIMRQGRMERLEING